MQYRVGLFVLLLLLQLFGTRAFAGNVTSDAVDAIYSGNVKEVERLLISGVDPNAKSESGAPLLMHAAYTGSRNITELLLARGADVTARNKSGQTALHAAAIGAKSTIASLLLDHGAQVNAKDNDARTPLYFLVIASSANGVKVFPNWMNWVAKGVFSGAPGERAQLAKVLLDNGATVETDAKDASLVYAVATTGDQPLLKLLIEHGAEINDARTGETPLHSAIAERHADAARLLINNNADVKARNQSGRTALHFVASLLDDPALAELLIAHGADVNARENKFRATPLFFAVEKRNLRVADVLRRHGGTY